MSVVENIPKTNWAQITSTAIMTLPDGTTPDEEPPVRVRAHVGVRERGGGHGGQRDVHKWRRA